MNLKPLIAICIWSSAFIYALFLMIPPAIGQTSLMHGGLVLTQAPSNPPPQNPTAKLFVIGKEAFCSRFLEAFSAFGLQLGFSKTQSTILAQNATSKVIQDFRMGRASDFLNAQSLLTESNIHLSQPQDKKIPPYIATASFLGRAMGLSENVSLALTAGELRFIPHVQKNSEIVVIAQNAASLTTERINKIIEVSRQLNIKINVVWVGETNESQMEIEEARLLAWIVSSTGGRFTNLGGQMWPCSHPM